MRRFALLSLLVVAGCGGGGSHPSDQNVVRVLDVEARDDVASYAVQTDGTPIVGLYDPRTATLKVVSVSGTVRSVGFPGEVSSPIRLSGDYAFGYTRLTPNAPYSIHVFHIPTGTQSDLTGEIDATEGNRAVVYRNGGLELFDFDTTDHSVLDIGDNDKVEALAGGRMLVSKEIVSGESYSHRYQVYSTSGTKLADLPTPEGYVFSDAIDLNGQGEVVGNAYRTLGNVETEAEARVVRWSPDGTPTVLDEGTSLGAVGIANDGSVLAETQDERGLRLFTGRKSKRVPVPSVLSTFVYTHEGVIFVEDVERNRVLAYRRG